MTLDIDHIDGFTGNNAIANLRLATKHENQHNSKTPKTNKSGFKGVSWAKRDNCFHACIRLNGKTKHLGCFKSPEKAAEAYKVAALEHYGSFARLA